MGTDVWEDGYENESIMAVACMNDIDTVLWRLELGGEHVHATMAGTCMLLRRHWVP